MDNNPARRSSESSVEEDTFVLAHEPPDEPDDVWYDAPLHPNEEHDKEKPIKSEASNESYKEPPDLKENHEEAIVKVPLLKLTEKDLSAGRTVLDTNLDTNQQTYIPPADTSKDLDEWKRKTNLKTDEVKITFHVLIPSNVDFQTDKDKVILCIWEKTHSEHPSINIEMKLVCYRQEGRRPAQLTGFIILKRGNFALSSLSYKYKIKRSGTSIETNLPRKSTWELADSKSKLRKLHCVVFKNNQALQGNYNQYDGYIYEPPGQGLLKTITGLFHGYSNNEDAESATRIFGRDIVHLLLGGRPTFVNILEATYMSDSLRHCMESRYNIRDNWVRVTLWELYTDILQNIVGITDDVVIQRKISVCLLMLNFRHLVGYKSGDPANELLCKSFLMKVCKKNRSTVEWDYLQKICMVSERKYIKGQLEMLVKDICLDLSNGKNPSWMYLLPVLHFLDGFCKPFDEIPIAFDHGATVPKWWGISGEIQHLSELFKMRHASWSIPLQHVIGKLEYMFEVDIYLPRAIMASLRLAELKDALDLDIFPYEIGCASIYYFLKTSREKDGYEKAIEKCTKTLQEQTLTAMEKRFGPRRVLVGLNVSGDLFSTSLRRLNSELVLNTACIFLSFVARFDILQLESTPSTDELLKFSLSMKGVSAETNQWINRLQNKSLPMFNLLQIWDQLLRPRGLPNSFHIEEWMTIMTTELKEKIHIGLTQDQRGQYERCLVEAYISGIDTYSQELQDLLSSFIHLALAEPLRSESNAVYQRLYDTISKKFLTEWREKLKDNKNMTLETLLTWPALPKLINVL